MDFSFNPKFLNIPRKIIDAIKLKEFIEDSNTKRIHFKTTHTGALSEPSNGQSGKIKVPFYDSIGPIISEELGNDRRLFHSQYSDNGYWRGFSTQAEFEAFNAFFHKYKEIVFLRDCLDLSLALSMNYENEERTEIGELEYQAKYENDTSAEEKLISICVDWIQQLPFYKDADYICAMPCTDRHKKSLPRRIVDELSNFENISDNMYWKSKNKSLKDATTVEEKLTILEESGLTIDRNLQGKAVFLLDDLYMSGTSMQYVGMKLKEAGAKWVFALCLVKSRTNTTR